MRSRTQLMVHNLQLHAHTRTMASPQLPIIQIGWSLLYCEDFQLGLFVLGEMRERERERWNSDIYNFGITTIIRHLDNSESDFILSPLLLLLGLGCLVILIANIGQFKANTYANIKRTFTHTSPIITMQIIFKHLFKRCCCCCCCR